MTIQLRVDTVAVMINESVGDNNKSAETVYVDETLQDLIPGFMQNRLNEFADLERMLSAKDFDAMSRIGHKLVGTGYNYGFQKLGDLAADLEKAGKEKNEAAARIAIDSIRKHVQSVNIVYVNSAN